MDNITDTGIILKGIGGFYYVETADKIYECKARGVFRKRNIKPCVGDRVKIKPGDDSRATIYEILPRKNSLIRPLIANIDNLIIVASVCEPTPSTVVIDKMVALACNKNIKPVIVISKSDLDDTYWLENIYNSSGIKTLTFTIKNNGGAETLKEVLNGKISAFTGNSGVGKSSLLNYLYDWLELETNHISKSLGRGKHTTRQAELFKIGESSYVADTPGFSNVDISRSDIIDKDNLQYCFEEFIPFIEKCKFNSCSHTCEKGCAVINAVNDNKIHKSRYKSYVFIYNEVKDVKKWEI